MIIIMEITELIKVIEMFKSLEGARELSPVLEAGGDSRIAEGMFYPGAKVLIRTVTHIQTGIVVDCDDHFVRLSSAAWIADTGRFADALANGLASGGEVEPFAHDCLVSLGAIVDATTIPAVPTSQR